MAGPGHARFMNCVLRNSLPCPLATGPLSGVRCSMQVVAIKVDAVDATNEPTASASFAPKALTGPQKKRRPTWRSPLNCDDADWIEPGAGTDDGDNKEVESRTYEEELGASMIRTLAKRKSVRMHELVELVEDRRKEVERLMADRRARRGEQRQKNRKSGNRPKARAASGE